MAFITFIIFSSLVIFAFYRWATQKQRYRNKISQQPFPAAWKQILEDRVGFYHTLQEQEKTRFEKLVQLFIAEKRIIGLKTKIDDTIRVLVAASAIIPIFGFRDWEYSNLGEVLVTEGHVRQEEIEDAGTNFVLGQVQPFQNHHYMTVSRSALEQGFNNMEDKKNVGIHEFAHIIDQTDGEVDGIPKAYLPPELIKPWTDMMYRVMEKIRSGDSTLDEYGATNEAEFFAVATEHFFEDPQLLAEKHPKLYQLLTRTFRQNPRRRFNLDFKALLNPYGRQLGRNSPCPCGSGEKYKNCCMGEGYEL
jgi:Mlc titration factor MtfA (ptsG expression regulator)